MDRCTRFVEHFSPLVVPKLEIQPGMMLEVVRVGLGARDNNDAVVGYAAVKLPNGETTEIELTESLFDPEWDGHDEVVEKLTSYGIVEADAVGDQLVRDTLEAADL